MGQFKTKKSKELPAVSTASLPDIVFMLLFFFMVSTTIRNSEVLVRVRVPGNTTELAKIEKKTLSSFIHVGIPNDPSLGEEPRIQLNDALASKAKELEEVGQFVIFEKNALSEEDRNKMMVVLKADRKTKMGIVNRITYECRKAKALRFMYSSDESKRR